jgi:hypothetical protein
MKVSRSTTVRSSGLAALVPRATSSVRILRASCRARHERAERAKRTICAAKHAAAGPGFCPPLTPLGGGQKPAHGFWRAALAACVLGCGHADGGRPSPSAATAERVVYGQDDRIELVQAAENVQRVLGDALVALVPRGRLRTLSSGAMIIDTEPLRVAHGLCEGVRFSEQPSAATCTGTLVGERLVLTAHHCVTNADHCRSLAFVFDFRLNSEGELDALAPDDVYSCSRIVAAAFDRQQGLDVAWVELDRSVLGHRPIAVSRKRPDLPRGTRLSAVGFGQGLPAKVDPDVRVLDTMPGTFTATMDAFVGSSGMPVFDAELVLVGFSMRGEDDYEQVGDCRVPRVLDVACADCSFGGEQVSYLEPALDVLDQSLGASGAAGASGAGAVLETAGTRGGGGEGGLPQAPSNGDGTTTPGVVDAGAGAGNGEPARSPPRLGGGDLCSVVSSPGSGPGGGAWLSILWAGLVGAAPSRRARAAQRARRR